MQQLAYIYKITNDVNNKVYVGKTEFDIQKRWKEHCGDYAKERCEKRPLYNAMRKYGINHFHMELIEETDDPAVREEYWIAYYDSYRSGYNGTIGGDGKRYLDYDKIVNTYLAVLNLAETARICGVSRDSVKHIMDERGIAIKHSSEILREKCTVSVKMYNRDGVDLIAKFNSLSDAARYLMMSGIANGKDLRGVAAGIAKSCKGERKTAYGRVWKFD